MPVTILVMQKNNDIDLDKKHSCNKIQFWFFKPEMVLLFECALWTFKQQNLEKTNVLWIWKWVPIVLDLSLITIV